MAWWELHKGSMLGVWMLVGAGAGLGAGRALRVAFSLPDLVQWLGLALGVALAGRAVTARYDPRQLEAAQRVVRSLEEGVRRSGSHAEKKLKTRPAKPTKPAKPKE